jgi:pimeloyl-ACP methyl ester carboxylesterase
VPASTGTPFDSKREAAMAGFATRRWTSRDGLTLVARDYAGADGVARLPVVCLHGLTRNAKDFDDVAPRLAATGRRIIVPDVRGRGASARDPNAANYHPRVYARDMAEMMQALGIAQAVFVGTSMGGIITMALAALRSKSVAAAILNDVGPAVAPEGIARILGYVGQPVAIANWAEAAEHCRRNYGAAWPDYGADDWDRLARRTFRENGGKIGFDYDPRILEPLLKPPPRGQSMLAWFLFRRLAKKRPVLLIRGAASDVITRSIADRMKAKAPDLIVTDVPGVGHAPTLTEPAAVAAIDGFLNSLP